jgi:hypothetical protein
MCEEERGGSVGPERDICIKLRWPKSGLIGPGEGLLKIFHWRLQFMILKNVYTHAASKSMHRRKEM